MSGEFSCLRDQCPEYVESQGAVERHCIDIVQSHPEQQPSEGCGWLTLTVALEENTSPPGATHHIEEMDNGQFKFVQDPVIAQGGEQ